MLDLHQEAIYPLDRCTEDGRDGGRRVVDGRKVKVQPVIVEKYIGTELNERPRSFRLSEVKFPPFSYTSRLLDLICEVAKLNSDRIVASFSLGLEGEWRRDVHLSHWPSMTSRVSIFRRGTKYVVFG